MHLSVSSVGTWLSCRRRWYLEHVLRLEPAELPPGLVAGNLFHAAIAKALQKEPVDWEGLALQVTRRARDPAEALAKAKAGFQLCDLSRLQGEVKAVEKQVNVEIQGITWLAFIDAILETELALTIVDHKLTSRPKWDWFREISDQLLLYMCLLQETGLKIRNGFWNVVVLPPIRTRVGEDHTSLVKRYVDKAQSYGPGQVIVPITVTDRDIEIGMEKIQGISNEILNAKVFRNPHACATLPCPYDLICIDESNAELLGFQKRAGRADLEVEYELST